MTGRHYVLIADQSSATVPINGCGVRPADGSHVRKLARLRFDTAHNQTGWVGATGNGHLVH